MAKEIKKITPVKKTVKPAKVSLAKTSVKSKVTKTKMVKPEVKKVDTQTVPVVQKPVLVKYIDKNIKISPRKLSLTVDLIRPLRPIDTLVRLKFTNNKASRILYKAVSNVIADAKHNFNLDGESLVFDQIFVGEGLKIKRIDKSHGSRFARGYIQKRHSRLTIIVKSKN
jgi:large subunit ribosomal protein L22